MLTSPQGMLVLTWAVHGTLFEYHVFESLFGASVASRVQCDVSAFLRGPLRELEKQVQNLEEDLTRSEHSKIMTIIYEK